ncbi:HpcH/HpaI aldolase/citrate lyase family protein [Aeromicrobium wangtongii]|uniref:CoA ester lyase n=1 Tax=Aeromicrobium wangtongii TaxID=2969247 RepID=A0ABY5M9A8_9ACTN|nr:CoA ester lyase [Aeromicrobium wangtongii]MCD9198711.1 CoA ester lyase [Aeromicrobium wangtongii]UUP13243.1 CoA ester lyase [Aeromicrobium wangtongii]
MTATTRSYLYVPGNAADKLSKAVGRGADALIVDLEDAVPLQGKDAARDAVVAWLAEQPAGGPVDLWVRVNSGPLRETDVQALANIASLTGIVLAKVEDGAEVVAIDALLTSLGDSTTSVMPLLETAAAVLDARAIAAGPRVQQLQIGEVDLAGELGLLPGDDEAELAPFRALVVLASTAAGIDPPVGPVSRITKDTDAFEVSTRRVQRQGFVGRACIHPAQLPVVHAVFTPTADDVAEAEAVIAMVAAAEARGTGVVLDEDGRLVDPAVLHSARRTLALAESAAGRDGTP